MKQRPAWDRNAVSPALQAGVLHEALPYVQSVQGKAFVVLCDGQWAVDPLLRAGFGHDVALLHLVGLRLVIVCGGAARTKADAMRTRRDLVACISGPGSRAVGLTSEDGGRSALDGGLIQRLHARDFIPVVLPRLPVAAAGPAEVSADTLACSLARGLGAEKLFILGDSPGVFDARGRLIATLTRREAAAQLQGLELPGAARVRLDLVFEALAERVRSAHFVDGRVSHALLLEVLSSAGDGTTVLPERAPSFLDASLHYMSRAEGDPG